MNQKEKLIKSTILFKESWEIYRKNLLKFIMVFLYGLAGFIPLLVVLVLFFIYNITGLAEKASLIVNFSLAFIGFCLFVASLYVAIVYSIRSKVASILLLKNNFTPAKNNFEEAKPYFIKFLGVSMLMMVLIIAWGFLFIIPALIFGIYYSFATYILVIEDKRPFSAVERSYDLVKGYFWPVFGRLFLVSIFAILVYAFISWPGYKMSEGSNIFIAYNVLINIIWAILAPYFIVYFYQLYKSLKTVKDKQI